MVTRWSSGPGVGLATRPPLHCRVTTLGKLFTPMCLCQASERLLLHQ